MKAWYKRIPGAIVASIGMALLLPAAIWLVPVFLVRALDRVLSEIGTILCYPGDYVVQIGSRMMGNRYE